MEGKPAGVLVPVACSSRDGLEACCLPSPGRTRGSGSPTAPPQGHRDRGPSRTPLALARPADPRQVRNSVGEGTWGAHSVLDQMRPGNTTRLEQSSGRPRAAGLGAQKSPGRSAAETSASRTASWASPVPVGKGHGSSCPGARVWGCSPASHGWGRAPGQGWVSPGHAQREGSRLASGPQEAKRKAGHPLPPALCGAVPRAVAAQLPPWADRPS